MKAYGTEEPKQVEVTLEDRVKNLETDQEAFEKDLSARFMQAEIRQRNIGKQDIQAAIRGQLAELVSRVESGVAELIKKEVTEQLRPYLEIHERSQQQVKDLVAANNERVKADHADFIKSFEDKVTATVLKVLQDYWVLDSEMHVLEALTQRPVTCRFCKTVVPARGEDNGAETR
jgi:glucuronate isomerase